MHGFCTDFARFQNVQRVLFDAKSDKGCRNCRVKNHVALIKNCDDSKFSEIETNQRLALLISGPRVRVPGGAPNSERQIVRFGVLSLCRKAAAHFLHTVCTFARIRGFSAQGLHSLLSFAFTTSTGHFDQSILGAPFSPHGFPAPSRRRFPAFPLGGSWPGIPYRRSCGFQGATDKTATKKPSQNKPALPSLFLEGHASRLCNG